MQKTHSSFCTPPTFVTRFAPSPTGLLHLGHAFSALRAFDAAQKANGRFLLRIDDIDHTRCQRVYEDAIYEDLHWLGLSWEEPVWRQSDHLGAYDVALRRLQDLGVIYRCFKSRAEWARAAQSAPHSDDLDVVLPIMANGPLTAEAEQALLQTNAPYAWRFNLAAAKETLGADYETLAFKEECARLPLPALAPMDGAIIARKDVGTSYHLACVWDDAQLGVTHIIRGEDLFCVTLFHRLLQTLLDLPAPIYCHHPLRRDTQGKRFAKRDHAMTLQHLRKSGKSAADIKALCGILQTEK